ncbi:MAG: helix-turn-helix domain-containing protein [Ruminococcaceae bacterium]|nr:helix-turn-helix domain-containing protein [Oscillospiraceae bacterium]
MKRKRRSRNSFLKKMLFSIVGLICIPMLCIQLYMIVNTNQEFRQENTAYYQRAVQSLALSFDKQLSSLSGSAYRMQTDKEILRPLTEDVKGYDLRMLAMKIDDYALDSPMVDVVGVYYAGMDMVLYKGTRHTLQEVCDKIFPADSQSSEDLAALLSGGSDTDILYSGAYADAGIKQMIVAKKLETGGGKDRQITAFFLIRDNVFERWCDVFVPNGQCFAIFDEEGDHILGNYDFFSEISQDPSFQAFVQGRDLVYTENKDVLIYKCQEVETGYTYMACVSRDTVEEQLNRYTAQAARSIVVTVILSAVLLSVTLYINYMPVRRIVKKHIGLNSGEANVSELELINTHLFAQDERITNQNQLLESFIVGDLLSGNGADAEDIEKHFPANAYVNFAVALSLLPMTTTQSAQVCKTFAKQAKGKLVITTVPYRTEIICVYACEETIDSEIFQGQLEKAVADEMGQMPVIRCGKVVENILDIQSSYTDVLLTNRGGEESADLQPEGYPQTLVADFAFYLGNGDWDKAIVSLNNLERINRDMKPTLKRFVHLKVLNLFLTTAPKYGQVLSNAQVNQLLAYTNGQHLYNMMRVMIVGIKEAKGNAAEESAGQIRKKLLAYVDQNFASGELCLSSAADYLHTSIYTVSRIFKEITGCGFKEYITEKRLQYACVLLKQSGMPISEVGAACGFDNAEYFTVIFRNRFGIAPSKFRKEAAMHNEDLEQNP